MNNYLYIQIGFGSHYVNSPGCCFSTEDYNEWLNKHYHNSVDDDGNDEKIIPTWFYLPYCDECKNYREFVNKVCSYHRSHRTLVTCSFSQNDFKTFGNREERCSVCCRLIERKLKSYTFEKSKKLANVCNSKRRREDYIIDELVQNVENYIS